MKDYLQNFLKYIGYCEHIKIDAILSQKIEYNFGVDTKYTLNKKFSIPDLTKTIKSNRKESELEKDLENETTQLLNLKA